MREPVTVASFLLTLSVASFAAGIAGLVYWRWLNPPESLTAAWRDALSTFGVFAMMAIFLAVLATYARIGARPRE